MKIKIVIAIVALATTLMSCNRRSQLLYMQNIDVASDIELISPPQYKLKSGDILHIQLVTHNPEFSQLFNNPSGTQVLGQGRDEASIYLSGYSINDDGEVSLPFLGSAKVAGLTIEEARKLIQNRSQEVYKDASVMVKMANFKVSVVGEVRRPGVFRNFNDNLNIFEAIAQVGDLTDNADRRNVLVVRPSAEGNRTYRLNLNDKSVLASEAFYLLPNDVVIVEPIGNKVFQMNLPYVNLTLSSISTIILLYNFITRL